MLKHSHEFAGEGMTIRHLTPTSSNERSSRHPALRLMGQVPPCSSRKLHSVTLRLRCARITDTLERKTKAHLRRTQKQKHCTESTFTRSISLYLIILKSKMSCPRATLTILTNWNWEDSTRIIFQPMTNKKHLIMTESRNETHYLTKFTHHNRTTSLLTSPQLTHNF